MANVQKRAKTIKTISLSIKSHFSHLCLCFSVQTTRRGWMMVKWTDRSLGILIPLLFFLCSLSVIISSNCQLAPRTISFVAHDDKIDSYAPPCSFVCVAKNQTSANHFHFSCFHRLRDSLGRPVIDFGDASMMMGFLAAQGSGHHSCLYRAACEYPDAGLEYAQAGHATLTGIEIFNRWGEIFFILLLCHNIYLNNVFFFSSLNRNSTEPQYAHLLSGMEKAAKEGMKNMPCNLLYKCPLWSRR